MPSDDNPRDALTSKDVALRAAAVRAVGATGSWADVATLMELAMGDKSPSVRLYAAASAASVVFRVRGGKGLPRGGESQVLDVLRAFNPQHNPALLMVVGALGTDKARTRLGRLLRDPHSDVRLAAAAAVRRGAQSALAIGDAKLEAEALGWLQSGKLPPDAVLELVRLAGEVGWSSWASALRQVMGGGGAVAEAAQEAQQRLAARSTPGAWEGLWLDAGGDVADEAARGGEGWLLLADGVAHDGEVPHAVVADGSTAEVEGLGKGRLLWARPVKAEADMAVLQTEQGTFVRSEGKALAKVVEERIAALGAYPPGCSVLARSLEEVEGVIAPRARALALWKAGQGEAAAEALDKLLAAKKPKADLFWHRANVALSLGCLDDAREHAQRYLDKAAKKGPHRTDAEALIASLTR